MCETEEAHSLGTVLVSQPANVNVRVVRYNDDWKVLCGQETAELTAGHQAAKTKPSGHRCCHVVVHVHLVKLLQSMHVNSPKLSDE